MGPFRHISIRVPWHDTGWEGTVCKEPKLNSACLKLKRIAANRDDDAEHSVRGQSLHVLPQEQWPCCVTERMAFMAPFEYTRMTNHPYVKTSPETHGHFAPTPLRHPPYSAAVVPFAWTLRENMAALAAEYNLDVRAEREPNLGFDNSWVQDKDNQTALLDCFHRQLKADQSLCFFYAKLVPYLEDAGVGRRVLLGVGRVKHVPDHQEEYRYTTKDLKGRLRSVLWERMIQHSIRPEFADGFLLPYHAAIERVKVDPDFSPVEIAAFSPADRLLEFSHASQHVTHDAALSSLLACAAALQNAKRHRLEGPWDRCIEWIDRRLGELWKMRGPCPGLGAALVAFGIELGTFVAREIAGKLGDNEDPWPLVDKVFGDPTKHLSAESAKQISKTLTEKWKRLPDERRSLLKLVSRFELTPEQATNLYVEEIRSKAGIDCQDKDILANPYVIYEGTRLTADPVSIWTADRGVFPEQAVRDKHPLSLPSALDGGTDPRRVRAMTVAVLEEAAGNGNTLLPQNQVVLRVREMPLQPSCMVDKDLMQVAADRLPPAVESAQVADGSPAYQLGRLLKMGDVIRAAVNARTSEKVKRLKVDADWRKLLDEHLKGAGAGKPDDMEERARAEKTAALNELAESRLSVLIGPAGTGKTTLLSILCDHPQIAEGGVLLLAPTGKARVRMEQATKRAKLKGFTIAQFLQPHRYDGATGRYRLSDSKADAGARTVMVDEASMLTEEMLGALLQALKGVDRLILIGDPRQLPPIGAGRPFVDIVKKLQPENVESRFPRVAPGYAELTVRRRQAGQAREDLRLAEWFSGAQLGPGDDDVFDVVVRKGASEHVRFVRWDTPQEVRQKLIQVLVEELGLSGTDDIEGFDKSLGGTPWNDLRFFNLGAAEKAEAWQILSPVRGLTHGVTDLNRLIHRAFRAHTVEAALKRMGRKIPKPMGAEQIVYGDKIINIRNHGRKYVYPEADARRYIANGEIGMTVGFYRRQGLPDLRWKLEVEFSSQPRFKYDFTGNDFGEESEPILELAYALTVHKAQGSEFGLVIFVLPNPCRLLSREMLYTALTRQRERVVILHQGERADLKKYSSDGRSETARRLTNLFVPPTPIEIEGGFFEERLIHRTRRGEMVRSKSEVIIADCLNSLGVDYLYERELTVDGTTKFPDFTIESAETGNIFYWEHCGMLHVPEYRKRWEAKLRWYADRGILPHEDGGGERGTLIVTRENERGGISSQDIEKVIRLVIRQEEA